MSEAERLVMEAVLRLGADARTREIAAYAGCGTADALDALCELEERGLVTPARWSPTSDGRVALTRPARPR